MNKHALDYNHIVDGIYIGTNQCCETHLDEMLSKEGITTDISLEENRLDAPFGVEYYIWIPVEDHTSPSTDQLDFGISALTKIASQGRKVYVHCKNGHGRAPTLICAYLISLGKSMDESMATIKSARPAVHFSESQLRAIREFGKLSISSLRA